MRAHYGLVIGLMIIREGSKHFTVEEITNRIWISIYTLSGCHICNSGIIDMGDVTLIFDTGLCIDSANDLRKAAIAFTGRNPSIIVNSHFHDDHFWGNQVFTEAKVIASNENVRITESKWKQDAARASRWAKKP